MVTNNLLIEKKRGQMKIQQMAFMLLAITLFFILVGLLVLGFKFSSIQEEASILNEKNALLLSTRIANSPEFSCGNSFGNSLTNCIDGDKFMMMKELSARYENFWGSVPNIIVEVVYPIKEKVECDAQNYPNCNIMKLYNLEMKEFYQPNFVSLCRKVDDAGKTLNKCELARIFVGYSKIK
jgi:hypothetical protein